MKKITFTPKQKHVIFWDWNGTLVKSKTAFRIHFILVVEEFMGRWATIRGKELEVFHAYETLRRSKSARKCKREECLRHVLKKYSFEPDDEFLAAFFARLNERIRTEPVFQKHARTTLNSLSKHYRMGVISNRKKEDVVHQELSQWLPPESWFTAPSIGSRKPEEKMFKYALQKMNVSPHHAVMIGDHWRNDIQGAIRSGMDAIWLHPKHKKRISYKKIGKRNVIIVRSLRDVPNLFSAAD